MGSISERPRGKLFFFIRLNAASAFGRLPSFSSFKCFFLTTRQSLDFSLCYGYNHLMLINDLSSHGSRLIRVPCWYSLSSFLSRWKIVVNMCRVHFVELGMFIVSDFKSFKNCLNVLTLNIIVLFVFLFSRSSRNYLICSSLFTMNLDFKSFVEFISSPMYQHLDWSNYI